MCTASLLLCTHLVGSCDSMYMYVCVHMYIHKEITVYGITHCDVCVCVGGCPALLDVIMQVHALYD